MSRLELVAGGVTEMVSSGLRASAAESTGVLPLVTTSLGPQTEAAGLCWMTWSTSNQS
jgi:hypothetical protein